MNSKPKTIVARTAATSPHVRAGSPRAASPAPRKLTRHGEFRRPATTTSTFAFSYWFKKFEHWQNHVVHKNGRKQHESGNSCTHYDKQPAYQAASQSKLRAQVAAFDQYSRALQDEIRRRRSVTTARRKRNHQFMQQSRN